MCVCTHVCAGVAGWRQDPVTVKGLFVDFFGGLHPGRNSSHIV